MTLIIVANLKPSSCNQGGGRRRSMILLQPSDKNFVKRKAPGLILCSKQEAGHILAMYAL
jgi:hypothetical protein